jgi:ubiquinone/menaquinone biosynthesis C-methylase UbiE
MRTNDAQVLVLSVLTDGPLHGYAINGAIERVSGQRLGAGSLYGALGRLEAKGLVESLAGVGRQRPVRLTDEGRALLEREALSMARVSGHVFESAVPGQVSYLDRVAASEPGRAYKTAMLEALEIKAGATVVDLGCGPGTDLGELAAAAGATGKVIGIDASTEMIEQAGERMAGLAEVDVRLGDIHELPIDDRSVDRARTDRVLQHVEEPGKALEEARRVLRPGGRLVMGEPDWDSLAIDSVDPEVSRAYTRHIADKIVRNGVIGRQLPRLAVEAGFEVPTVLPITSVFRELRAADQVFGFQRNIERAIEAGYVSAGAGREWLEGLAAGPFLATVTLYVVVAEVALS